VEQAQLEEKVRDLEQTVRILLKWYEDLSDVITVDPDVVTIKAGASRLLLSTGKVELNSGGSFEVRAASNMRLRADGTGELASSSTLTLRGSQINVN
jgi:hypothetical protein